VSKDLKDRPQEIYDDGQPAWKTNLDNDDGLEESFDSPSATDDDLPDNHPSKSSKSDSVEELKEKENSSSEQSDDSSDSKEGSLYKGDSKKKSSLRSKVSRKKATIIFAIVSAIISAIAAVTTMAPSLIINNLKEMLLGRISSVQMHHGRKYRQKTIPKMKTFFTKDGRISQRIISEMQADGYKINFNPADGKTITGIDPPGRYANGIIGTGIGDHIDSYMEVKHPFRTARWKTKRMNAIYSTFKIPRTSVVDTDLTKKADGDDIDPKRIVNREVAKDVLDGEPGKIDINTTSDKPDGDEKTADEARRQELAGEGSEIGDRLEESKKELIENGTPVEEIADDGLTKSLTESGDGLTKELVDVAERAAKSGGLAGKFGDAFKTIANPLDVLDRICIVRNRLQGVVVLARTTRSISLIRYAMVFVNAADDSRRGKADPKLMHELMRRVTAEDKNGNAIGASPGFGYMMKTRFSKSKNDAMRSPVAVDGKLTGVAGGINGGLSKVPGIDAGCPYIQNPFIQIGVGVGSLVAGFFSGGSSAIATQAAQQSMRVIVKEALKEAVEKITVKAALKGVLRTAAIEISFEAIMTLAQMYIEKGLNLPFTGQEKGGQLGDILVAGTGAANKQRSLAAGMVPATTEEYAMAQQEYIAWRKNELKQMNFAQRMLDTENMDSLIFNIALATPTSTTDFIDQSTQKTISLATSIMNPGALFKSFASTMSPRAYAAVNDEITFDEYKVKVGDRDRTLATDPAGNLQVIMRSDIEEIDPEVNIEELKSSNHINETTLEPSSDAFKDHIEYCIESTDTITRLEKNEYDCLADDPTTVKFKAHLAYLDLVDGLEAEFLPEEIAKSSTSGGSSPSTVDGGVAGGFAVPYTNPIGIELTSIIPGTSIRIATNTLPQFVNMLNAAKAEGVDLMPISSGWRDPQQQIALRKQNCPDWQNSPAGACRPPTAKPGTSIHERGQAIDFGSMCFPNGKTCPGNRRWEWLTANAGKFGFKPLSSEAWHWSVTGN
jgi:hypothetical protein